MGSFLNILGSFIWTYKSSHSDMNHLALEEAC